MASYACKNDSMQEYVWGRCSDQSEFLGQLYWAAVFFRLCPSGYCFVSFFVRTKKEMKFPNGIH